MLEELENVEQDSHFKYDVFITPPADIGNDTDEDSGDDDCNDPNTLNRNQLEAEAELYINNEPVSLDISNDNINCNDSNSFIDEPSTSRAPYQKRSKKTPKVKPRNWQNGFGKIDLR